MSDDPFGRREEERDAFGNPIGRRPEDSLFHDPDAGSPPPAEGSRSTEEPARAPSGWAPPAPGGDPVEPPPTPHEPGDGARSPTRWLPPTDTTTPPAAWQPPPEPPGPAPQPSWWASQPAATAGSHDRADYGQRVGAAVIDFLVRFAIALPFGVIGYAAGWNDDIDWGFIAGGLAALAYAPLMMARTGGQTVGHRAVRTRIVRTNGQPTDGGSAFLREVVVKTGLIEAVGVFLTLGILPLVNYLWPLWDAKDEALHDKICSTKVVRA